MKAHLLLSGIFPVGTYHYFFNLLHHQRRDLGQERGAHTRQWFRDFLSASLCPCKKWHHNGHTIMDISVLWLPLYMQGNTRLGHLVTVTTLPALHDLLAGFFET